MEKTRVKKGEKYWYLDLIYLDVIETQEMNNGLDNFHYRKNNYFATKEQAIAMATKLRAVLKGADVIEQGRDVVIYELLCQKLDGEKKLWAEKIWEWIEKELPNIHTDIEFTKKDYLKFISAI